MVAAREEGIELRLELEFLSIARPFGFRFIVQPFHPIHAARAPCFNQEPSCSSICFHLFFLQKKKKITNSKFVIF